MVKFTLSNMMHWTCKINIQQLTKENKISAMNAEVFGPLLVNSLFLYIRWNREDEKSAINREVLAPCLWKKASKYIPFGHHNIVPKIYKSWHSKNKEMVWSHGKWNGPTYRSSEGVFYGTSKWRKVEVTIKYDKGNTQAIPSTFRLVSSVWYSTIIFSVCCPWYHVNRD